MPSKGTRPKDVSPVPSSEPRAPTHKSSHTSGHGSGEHTKTSKKSDSKSRGSKPGSKGASGSKKEGSKKEGSKKQGDSAAAQSGTAASKRSRNYDVEAPPSRDDDTAVESTPKQRGPVDWSLFPYALLGFIFGLLVGAILVVFFGFCCCIFADWRPIWRDRTKRAFLGGFAAGVLIAIIVWLALFIALVIDD